MSRRASRVVSVVAAGAVAVVTVGGLSVPRASAHEDEAAAGSSAAAERHAREDLVGVPMSTIRSRTAKVAAARSTAERRAEATGMSLAQAAAGDASAPSLVGAWSAPRATPVVPVFQAVLPDGAVLMWDSIGDGPIASTDRQDFTRAMVWDPATDQAQRVDLQGYNIFCAGYTQLPNGDVLVVGGNKNVANDGIVQTHLFRWRSRTWQRGPDMAAERWYPSVAALATGEAVIVGGGAATSEVYQTDGTLRALNGLNVYLDRAYYPMLVPRGDGRLEVVGPNPLMTIDTRGRGSLDAGDEFGTTNTRDGINRTYGSFATYLPDQTLVTGGGDLAARDASGRAIRQPTASSVVVDTSGDTTTTRAAAPMSIPRRQHSLTVLPDGSVLATGGMSRAEKPLVDLANPVLAAERWDPATGAWSTLAAAAKVRQYHSSASLLPDGRVLTGGGGVCGDCVQAGYLERNVEYYSPPYLFAADGSPAQRPVVTGAPTVITPADTFTVTSSQASSIAKMALVRLGAPTHGTDQGQRYVPLRFTASGSTLTVRTQATREAAPPGYYMLFAIDQSGVPSRASMVQVGVDTPPTAQAGSPQTGLGGRAVTLDGSRSSDPQGDALTYRWTQTAGPTVRLSSATVVRPTFTAPTGGGTLRFELRVSDGLGESEAAATQVEVAPYANLALGRPATQISTYAGSGAALAVDGRTDGRRANGSVTLTARSQPEPWWEVDLGVARDLDLVRVWNRTDACCVARLEGAVVLLSEQSMAGRSLTDLMNDPAVVKRPLGSARTTTTVAGGVRARYVRVQSPRTTYLSLAEVQVFGWRR